MIWSDMVECRCYLLIKQLRSYEHKCITSAHFWIFWTHPCRQFSNRLFIPSIENCAVDVHLPKMLLATHLMTPESLNLAPFKTTAPPKSTKITRLKNSS